MLPGWEKACLELEQADHREAAETLYRVAHNLKSGGAAVGLTELSAFIHHVEDELTKFLAGKLERSPQLIRLFFDVHTTLTDWMTQLRTDAQYIPKDRIEGVHQVINTLSGSQTSGATMSETPPAENAGENTIEPPAVSATSESTAPKDSPTAAPTPATAPVQVAPPAVVAENKPTPTNAKPTESVRVASNKLDMLIQLVGELSTQQAIVWHGRQNGMLHSKSCDNAIQLIQKNSKDLQLLALTLRMQPLQSLFQRLERAGRDLARAQSKKIDIVCKGEHVELDRAVIERISEALMHVIRNAVDHGIEDPVARFDANKPPTATISLEGSQEPGGILITIRDDGRGLNTERILKKALERGLVSPEQKFSEAEVQRFIFLHGFSTAEKVTDISGRGVGMDVVKTAVQSIGGSISVASQNGAGTTFSISLPTTLSIVDSLILEVSASRYAIPVQDVSEIVDLGSYKMENAASRGRLLSLRKSLIPVEHLSEHLPPCHQLSKPLTEKNSPAQNSIQTALIVRAGTDCLAFQVDRILGQQPVSVRPLPGGLDTVAGYTGGAILGDGDPCIILNLPALVRRHLERIGGQHESRNAHNAITNSAAEGSEDHHQSAHLIFHVGAHILATPLLSVREILSEISCDKLLGVPPHVVGCIDIRGQVLTVMDLGMMLSLPPAPPGGPFVVIDVDGEAFALIVDRIESVSDLVVTHLTPSVSENGASLRGICGLARYRDQVISVVDIAYILKEFKHLSAQAQTTGHEFKTPTLEAS